MDSGPHAYRALTKGGSPPRQSHPGRRHGEGVTGHCRQCEGIHRTGESSLSSTCPGVSEASTRVGSASRCCTPRAGDASKPGNTSGARRTTPHRSRIYSLPLAAPSAAIVGGNEESSRHVPGSVASRKHTACGLRTGPAASLEATRARWATYGIRSPSGSTSNGATEYTSVLKTFSSKGKCTRVRCSQHSRATTFRYRQRRSCCLLDSVGGKAGLTCDAILNTADEDYTGTASGAPPGSSGKRQARPAEGRPTDPELYARDHEWYYQCTSGCRPAR